MPPGTTDALVAQVEQLPGLIGLRVQRGVSLRPAGDVVTIETLNSCRPS